DVASGCRPATSFPGRSLFMRPPRSIGRVGDGPGGHADQAGSILPALLFERTWPFRSRPRRGFVPTPDAPNTPLPGDPGDTGPLILGRFRIERVLGRGGMGEVLLARDTLLHRRVAIKRLRPEDAKDADRRRAVLSEARRASQINDRRIASIYDVLEA